ncbi:MAG: aromatic ring-hydroxylating dioxygenase subunit alpha, partial [Pseudomonadota bacterium]
MERTDLIALIKEARTLADANKTSLAPQEMTLSPSLYTDPDRFEQERDVFFRDRPLCLGPSCLVRDPGDFFTFNDTGTPILVIRNEAGELNAFVNICSHRSAPVAVDRGHVDGSMISCPYHGWSYTLDGALRGIPGGKDGFPCVNKSEKGLRPVPIYEKDGIIYVSPNPDRDFDVDEADGGLAEDMSFLDLKGHHHYDTRQIPVKQNWKSLMEGYHEFYHFASLHPTTIATTAHSNVCHYTQLGRHHRLTSPNRGIQDLMAKPEAEWVPREQITFVYYAFPATVFFVVSDHFQLWRVYPVDAENSVVYQTMFLPE